MDLGTGTTVARDRSSGPRSPSNDMTNSMAWREYTISNGADTSALLVQHPLQSLEQQRSCHYDTPR